MGQQAITISVTPKIRLHESGYSDHTSVSLTWNVMFIRKEITKQVSYELHALQAIKLELSMTRLSKAQKRGIEICMSGEKT